MAREHHSTKFKPGDRITYHSHKLTIVSISRNHEDLGYSVIPTYEDVIYPHPTWVSLSVSKQLQYDVEYYRDKKIEYLIS